MGKRSTKATTAKKETKAAAAEVTAVQKKQEEKVAAQEQQALATASSRLRLMQTGGLRLLFSPARNQTSEGSQLGTTLGTGM